MFERGSTAGSPVSLLVKGLYGAAGSRMVGSFSGLSRDKRKVERATGECRPGRTRIVLGAAEGAGRADQNERDGQCERSRTTADPDSIDRA